MEKDDLLQGNLFGYLHDYSMLVQYMVTTEGVYKHHQDIEIFGGQYDNETRPVHVNAHTYHGFQVSPNKAGSQIWSKFVNMGLPNLSAPKNEKEVFDQQVAMIRDFYPQINREQSRDVQKVCVKLSEN